MKNVGCLILLMLLFSSMAFAVTIPIEYTTSVDFTDKTQFRLLLPNGVERQFNWLSNETHSDVVFNSTLYYSLNETAYCSTLSYGIKQYEDITTKFVDLTSMCNSLLEGFNSSYGFNGVMWSIQNERVESAENKTESLEQKMESCVQEKNICETRSIALTGEANEGKTCKSDLSSCNSSKNTYAVIGFAIGVGLGWYLWGRKKKQRPSEQYEFGTHGDEVDDRYDGLKE